MIVDVKAKSLCQIDVDSVEAFRILCKTLDMDIVLDEDTYYFVMESENGENAVYFCNANDHCIDDRGDLFVALRNVAVNIFPNISFRNADYIYRSN